MPGARLLEKEFGPSELGSVKPLGKGRTHEATLFHYINIREMKGREHKKENPEL